MILKDVSKDSVIMKSGRTCQVLNTELSFGRVGKLKFHRAMKQGLNYLDIVRFYSLKRIALKDIKTGNKR